MITIPSTASSATPPALWLIGNFPGDRQESMQRFGQLLATGMARRGWQVEHLQPQPFLTRLCRDYRYQGLGKYLGYYDKFVRFPSHLRARRRRAGDALPVVHVLDQGNAAYATLFDELPTILTCHDLLQIRAAVGEFPQHRLKWPARRQQAWIVASLRRAPFVACVSRRTEEDLIRFAGTPATRRALVPNALNYPYRRIDRPTALARLEPLFASGRLDPAWLDPLASPEGWLFNLGGGQWYKNRPGVFHIHGELRKQLTPSPRLVLAGKPLSPEHRTLAEAHCGSGRWTHVGRVDEDQLEALYSLTDGLFFPSWEEGFGWPIAEAQSCGCCVFTSDRAPMTEVGGTHAVYLDPRDPADAAQRIAEAWPRRAEIGRAAATQADRWHPDAMLARYEALYLAPRHGAACAA